MKHTEVVNKAAGAPAALNDGLAAGPGTKPAAQQEEIEMAVMRAKMQVQSVKNVEPWPNGGTPSMELQLSAVCGKWGDDGKGEDNTYAKYTPQANLSMTINNEELFGKIKPGQTFYLDFIDAEEAAA
jgi:hypothetical protein